MEFLNSDFILSDDEISILDFDDNPEETQEEKTEEKETTEDNVDGDSLFGSESVGSEDNIEEKKNPSTTTEDNSSPNNSDFYYSLTNALVEDGVLSDLDEDFVKTIKSPEDFAEAIEKQVNAKLDEKQKRITAALEADVESNVIRQYEGVLGFLDSVKEDAITEESERGEKLRKDLIYQDLLNRGYSKERAEREVKKSFDSGSDIEDAKDALISNKEFYNSKYKELIEESQKEIKAEKERTKKQAEQLKKSLLESDEVFKGISIDEKTRKKAYENITKPVYKTEDGEYLTAIQKYEEDNPVEFRRALSILFTMTDGFTNIDKLVQKKVNKEVKNSIRNLEHTLRTSNRQSGNLQFMGGGDSESYSGKGWQLDI
jgi:hypothetical protein